MRVTVAGVGYVGLSIAVLLAQSNDVKAVTTTSTKADMLNRWESPIRDEEIARFFSEASAGSRILHLEATTDCDAAYA